MNRPIAFASVLLLGGLVTGCTTSPDSQVPPAPPVSQVPPAPPVSQVPRSLPLEPERSQEKTDVREVPADLDNVLKYFGVLRNLPGNDFRREQEAARQAFAQVPSEVNRVRLALVTSLAVNSQRDERRALELLEPMAKGARTDYTPLRGFALVIQSFVMEQIKVGSNAQALKDKLDQLMSLEKSLAERERPAAGGGR